MTYIGVPLIVGGLIIKNEDDHFHNLRNTYIPNFRYHYDDYLQYLPAVAMLGLKIGGVEGRSSWPRMLVSDAITASIMGVAVNTVKHTVSVTRHDGSNTHSFPSGHTAMAFMAATMLHKEYGMTRSPWYSIGGYTVATATAVSRMLNNKHWLSDVMVGAGIGILSTELGYFLADLIFKDKGITHSDLDFEAFNYQRNPSFFGIYMGFSLMPTKFNLSPDVQLKASPGSTAGLEGAWFMNRYIGFGGRFSATSMPLSLTKPLPNPTVPGTTYQVNALKSDPLDMIGGYIGSYLSYPVTNRFLLGTKLLVGCNYSPASRISVLGVEGNKPEMIEKEIVNTNKSFNIGYSTNASVSYILRPNLNVRIFLDYTLIPSHFVSYVANAQKETDRFELHKTLQTFTLGASVNIMLW
ncbi:MAG: phosphatase PAP2 family protein [Parabacteroides sp.]|nr:phosphatase PAP2 family protein [Parabacteroides sp.]